MYKVRKLKLVKTDQLDQLMFAACKTRNIPPKLARLVVSAISQREESMCVSAVSVATETLLARGISAKSIWV